MARLEMPSKKVVAGIVLVAAAAIAVCLKLSPNDADATQREATEEEKAHRTKGRRLAATKTSDSKESDASGKVRGKRNIQHKKNGARTVRDGGSAEEENVVVMSVEEEEARMSSANSELTQDMMKELSEIFSQASASNLVAAQFVQTLSNYKPSVVLEAAKNVLRNGNAEEKGNALYAVGMLFGKESATGISFDITHPKAVVMRDDGNASGNSSESDAPEDVAPLPDRPSNELISTVSAGLSDEDKGVRDMAFDVMRSLPDEESGALAANLMSEGDVALQRRLMLEDGENNIRLSLMGMGSESQEVRNLAAANIKNLTGQEFDSQKAASEWYRTHYNEFPQGVEKSTSEHEAIKQKGENK